MTKNLLSTALKAMAFLALITQLLAFQSQAHASVLVFDGEPNETNETVFVRLILLDGNTVFPPTELSSMVVNLTGKIQTVESLSDIAGKVAEKYKSAGYLKARVWVPEESIRGGLVTMKIDEGIEKTDTSIPFFIPLVPYKPETKPSAN